MALQLRRELNLAPLQQALIASRANPSPQKQQEFHGITSETSQPFRSPRVTSSRTPRGALVISSSGTKSQTTPTPTEGSATATRSHTVDSSHQLTRKEVSWLGRLYERYRQDPTEKEQLQQLMWEVDRETMDSQQLDAKLHAVASVAPSPAVTPTSPSQAQASSSRELDSDGPDEAPPILSFEQLLQYAQSIKMKFDYKLSEEEQMTLDAFVLLGGKEDKSGEIQVETLRRCVEEFHLNVDVDAFIAVVDKDGDGTVSYSEFAWLYNQGIFDPGTPAVNAGGMESQRNSTRARLSTDVDVSGVNAAAAGSGAVRMSATVLDSPARRKTAARVKPPGVACKHLHDTDEIVEKLMEVDEVHHARVTFVNRNAKESMTGLVRRLSLLPSAVTQYASFRNVSSVSNFGTGRISDFCSGTFGAPPPLTNSASGTPRSANPDSTVPSLSSPRQRARPHAEVVAEKLNALKQQACHKQPAEPRGHGDGKQSTIVQALREQWSTAARAVANQQAVVARHVEQLRAAIATMQQLENTSREASAALRQALSQARHSNAMSAVSDKSSSEKHRCPQVPAREGSAENASPRDRDDHNMSATVPPEQSKCVPSAAFTSPPADDASQYEDSDFTAADTAPQSRSSSPHSPSKSEASCRSAASTFTVESSHVIPAATLESHETMLMSTNNGCSVDSASKNAAPSSVADTAVAGQVSKGQRPATATAARAAHRPPNPPRQTRPPSAARPPTLHHRRSGNSMRFVRKYDKSFQELISARDGPSSGLSVTPPAVATAIRALHCKGNQVDGVGEAAPRAKLAEGAVESSTVEGVLAEQLERWIR